MVQDVFAKSFKARASIIVGMLLPPPRDCSLAVENELKVAGMVVATRAVAEWTAITHL